VNLAVLPVFLKFSSFDGIENLLQMIERHWTGLAKKERANEYITHLQNDTFKQIAAIDGFISARILKRELAKGTEFLIITEWETLDAIKQFAGADYDIAVVPALVREMMISYDDKVRHYEVYFSI
jgi:heme-degrading monooxygenase HmoA